MPPLPQACLALAAYARAQEDLVGEVRGGGALFCGCRCPCGGHKAVPRVPELVSALAVWQDPCLEHPWPPRWLRSPVAVSLPPHSRVPPAPPGTTLQQQPGVPAGLGVPAAPCLPAPVSLSPRALPADRLPGKKTRNYKEGRCVSQREGGRGGQECPQRWQMALPRVHCSF